MEASQEQTAVSLKTCLKCKAEKPVTQFGKDKNREDGLYPWCKGCKNSSNRQWKEKNKAKVCRSSKDYYESHKDAILSHQREKYADERLASPIVPPPFEIVLFPCTKTCTKCNSALPLSKFRDSDHGKYGVRADCVVCEYKRSRRGVEAILKPLGRLEINGFPVNGNRTPFLGLPQILDIGATRC